MEKNLIKDKIAFSLFTMFYNNYRFNINQSPSSSKKILKEMRTIWKSAIEKNRAGYFFVLADQIFRLTEES